MHTLLLLHTARQACGWLARSYRACPWPFWNFGATLQQISNGLIASYCRVWCHGAQYPAYAAIHCRWACIFVGSAMCVTIPADLHRLHWLRDAVHGRDSFELIVQGKSGMDMYKQFDEDRNRGNFDLLPELHAVLSGMKASAHIFPCTSLQLSSALAFRFRLLLHERLIVTVQSTPSESANALPVMGPWNSSCPLAVDIDLDCPAQHLFVCLHEVGIQHHRL